MFFILFSIKYFVFFTNIDFFYSFYGDFTTFYIFLLLYSYNLVFFLSFKYFVRSNIKRQLRSNISEKNFHLVPHMKGQIYGHSRFHTHDRSFKSDTHQNILYSTSLSPIQDIPNSNLSSSTYTGPTFIWLH
jgi:hypothetical protein